MVLSGFCTVKNVEYSEPTLFVGFCIGVLHIHGSTFLTTLRHCDVGPSLIYCCATIGTEWYRGSHICLSLSYIAIWNIP
jgi:hypothetical protein